MEEEKSKNSKIIWIILFTVIAVVLCYLFVVLYFFYISPNNIATKLALWPFLSDNSVGEMYLDATVEINFNTVDDFEDVTVSVVGVNVRSDGWIVAPYSELKDCADEQGFTINTNSGKVYQGEILFSDENYDIAILKCLPIAEDEEKISLPFVRISTTNLSGTNAVLAVSSPMQSQNVWSGTISADSLSYVYSIMDVDGVTAIDFVVENCYCVEIEDLSFTGGAVFDKSGHLLGLSYGEVLDDGTFAVVPAGVVDLVLDDVIDDYENEATYQNSLVGSFSGVDGVELYCHMDIVSQMDTGNTNAFYFDGVWIEYSDSLINFRSYQNFDSGFSAGYFLLEDFVYGDTTIAQGNVLSGVSVRRGGRTVASAVIYCKTDLFDVLYQAQAGDIVVLSFWSASVLSDSPEIQTVTFAV